MENYNELRTLINEKANIEEYINHAKTIGLFGRYSKHEIITFLDSENGRYDFGGVEKIIGEEKLRLLVNQFQGLVTLELSRAKEEKEKELARFSIHKELTA